MKRSQESRLPESAGGKGDGSDRARGNPPNPTLRGSANSEAAIIPPSLIHGKAIAPFFRSGYRDTDTRLKDCLLVELGFRIIGNRKHPLDVYGFTKNHRRQRSS